MSSNLDFVRSIAVLMVLFDHILETLGTFYGFKPYPYAYYLGRIGVILFFVLTSLVLLKSLERGKQSGKSSVFGFFLRRAFRIYPLSILCVLSVVALEIPATSWQSGYQPVGLQQLFANITLTQNLFYAKSILSVLWSLPYEMQMYLCLPFIFWFLDGQQSIRNALGLWLIGVVLAIVQPMLIGRLSIAQFAPCFLAGGITFALGRASRARLPFAVLPISMAILVAGYFVIANFSKDVHPRWLGWSFCLTLGVLLPYVKELQISWLRRTFMELARYSYGIYLFHMFALWCGFNLMQQKPLALKIVISAAVLSTLAISGHHLIEKPGIEIGARIASRISKE